MRSLGGPADLFERPDTYLEAAPVVLPVAAPRAGFIARCDCRSLGLSVLALGGGRRRASDAIDFAVGLSELVQLGDQVEAGQPLALVHARTLAAAQQAVHQLQSAYEIDDVAAKPDPVLYSRISGSC